MPQSGAPSPKSSQRRTSHPGAGSPPSRRRRPSGRVRTRSGTDTGTAPSQWFCQTTNKQTQLKQLKYIIHKNRPLRGTVLFLLGQKRDLLRSKFMKIYKNCKVTDEKFATVSPKLTDFDEQYTLRYGYFFRVQFLESNPIHSSDTVGDTAKRLCSLQHIRKQLLR